MSASSLRRRFLKHRGTTSRISPRESSPTVTWNELQDWQKDNIFIPTGYRRLQYSWRGTIKSVFAYLHNESVNVHSHLWGGVFFIYLLATVRVNELTAHETSSLDSVLFALFFCSAIFCQFSSSLFHASACHSREVNDQCQAYDYAGITVLNLGSHYPLLYYGFFCEPHYQKLYILTITTLNVAATIMLLDPEYAKPTRIGIRTAIFIALGCFSCIAIAHACFIHGFTVAMVDIGYRWFILSGSIYMFGAILYANRVPERFSPGTFDYFFASHQIFHACVTVGAYLHYVFISVALDHYYSQSVCRMSLSWQPA
ncbi:hypothetical protein GYMLUDRAFT_50550 [Collybiopsis luxurians FD-317 M1]|uniref:Unplaced genomic scaffold GYMLUscaffold_116, whole genome shotgun sequence n=1 Tax=Collybiopsis luxurians FD-317 M1 TaxID=944289 RepID=A0A0D0BP81_9AGAR|nr:hypothetical protein GYMLUDRAFT_50550 [Collybiopsis luxurians FD-317 M1]